MTTKPLLHSDKCLTLYKNLLLSELPLTVSQNNKQWIPCFISLGTAVMFHCVLTTPTTQLKAYQRIVRCKIGQSYYRPGQPWGL